MVGSTNLVAATTLAMVNVEMAAMTEISEMEAMTAMAALAALAAMVVRT